MIPQVASHYRIISKLGEGGMGEVHLAEDTVLGRKVAIKFIPHRSADARSKKRLINEARAAARLDHPNICSIYEVGEEADFSFIVMQYIKGETIADRISKKTLELRESLQVALQVADALSEAHMHGIIHRDIKPQNIIITARGQAKVLDFGLAKIIRTEESDQKPDTVVEGLTESGKVMGTLCYMSPEQLRNQQLDGRVDIFSFGVVLYQMLTGELPFTGASPFEIAASILKDSPVRVEDQLSGFPPAVTELVKRCLEKDREKRSPSFNVVKRILETILQDQAPAMSAAQTTMELPQRGRSTPASGSPSKVSPPTIMVLPLEAVGAGEEGSFIGIGLAHALTTVLAKVKDLSVLSKSAGAGRIDQTGRRAQELARELGATILLEGEVVPVGQEISIMARLTDAETGRVIWGERYRGVMSDLFSIQDAVCEGVAAALKINISSGAHKRMTRPIDINAFEMYSKGRAFIERRDVKENIDFAIQMFEAALKIDSDFALAQAGLGEAYWLKYQATRDNRWVERAISASDLALVLDPRQAQVHISLGIIYHGTSKVDRAIEEFERAIELQPLSDEAHKWLGRCYQNKGDTERAINYFEKAIEIRPGYWDNYIQLGFCLYTFGHYQDASEQFRRAITIQPDNYLGYNNLGGMYYLLGLYEDAIAMYRRAIEIHPDAMSHSNLGTAYFYLGRYEEAIESYKEALKLNPSNDFYYRNLGDGYLRLGKKQEAEEQFRSAIQLLNEHLVVNPRDAGLLGRLAACKAKLQLRQEAVESIERASAIEPHNTTLMYESAVVYALIGDADKAIGYLDRAIAGGYSRSEAMRDPDLETLGELPGYKSLFATEE